MSNKNVVLSKEAKETLQDFCYARLCYECPFQKEDESYLFCKIDYPHQWRG